jgi:hypothetical protein
MRNITYTLWPVLIASALALSAGVHAATQGSSPQGYAWLEGGVDTDDNSALDAARGRYSLGIVTAERGTGAYLADVDVRISDARGALVLEHRLQGPRLMIALPPGRYTVQAAFRGQVQKHEASIGAGGQHQSVFAFAPDAKG